VNVMLHQVREGDGDTPLIMIPDQVVTWLDLRPEPPLYNAYKCGQCGRVAITIDIHRGVTPMTMACRVAPAICDGTMQSMMYPDNGAPPPDSYLAQYRDRVFHWYRPGQAEFIELDKSSKDHVMRGGLLIRKGELL
jgi:hypothetical protein